MDAIEHAVRVGMAMAGPGIELKMNLLNVTVSNGKYTVIQDKRGHLKALRYGEPWRRDLTGDNLVLALAEEVQELREAIAGSNKVLLDNSETIDALFRRICPVCDNMIKDPSAKACLACLPQME